MPESAPSAAAAVFAVSTGRFDLIDKTEIFRVFCRHKVVALNRRFDDIVILAGMLHVNFIQALLQFKISRAWISISLA